MLLVNIVGGKMTGVTGKFTDGYDKRSAQRCVLMLGTK